MMNRPVLVFLAAFLAFRVASWLGAKLRTHREKMDEEDRDDFGVILAAALTLLGLIIGFTFSMALSRYDQRKNYEEEEANAIGTEYLRADLLPADTAVKVREQLKSYLAERIKFYQTRNVEELQEINATTERMQAELWTLLKGAAQTNQTAIGAVTVTGMNDVLNRQGYTQAAWWNRIPAAAWALMWTIGMCCTFMLGYYVRPGRQHWVRLSVMPLIISISFMLIADIDSPRSGVIRVQPQNLLSLQEALK
jgi:hypothetical protein